eukprot:scaffold5061_cov378-Prasinococcus_capsulatus_cf.AAC.4
MASPSSTTLSLKWSCGPTYVNTGKPASRKLREELVSDGLNRVLVPPPGRNMTGSYARETVILSSPSQNPGSYAYNVAWQNIG